MKMTVDRHIFIQQFENFNRKDNFSMWALNELFDYFEQYENDCGEEMKLDVIAICCDYNEMSFNEVRAEYQDYKEMTNDEIVDALTQETSVVQYNDDSIIFQAF